MSFDYLKVSKSLEPLFLQFTKCFMFENIKSSLGISASSLEPQKPSITIRARCYIRLNRSK